MAAQRGRQDPLAIRNAQGLSLIFSRLKGVVVLPPGVEATGQGADTRNSPLPQG
ncbi:MAG: hypothetical protein ABSB32_15550 [Thermodesulfobacteriota bacterium]